MNKQVGINKKTDQRKYAQNDQFSREAFMLCLYMAWLNVKLHRRKVRNN